jgi:glutamate transport system permease protein
VIGLTVYNAAVIAEIIRSGVLALPSGQMEAAYAVGLTRGQTMRLVQLPQAFRIMLPALISQLIVVLKDTSLGFIILYPELVRTGGIIVQNLRNPIPTYLVIGAIFVLVNYALSRLAVFVERRLSKSTISGAQVEAMPDPE